MFLRRGAACVVAACALLRALCASLRSDAVLNFTIWQCRFPALLTHVLHRHAMLLRRSPIVRLALSKAYLCRHPIMCLASIKAYLCRRPSGYCKCCGEVLRPFRLAFGCLVLGAPSGFHNVRCTALHKGVVFHSFLIANLTFLLNFAQEPLRGSKMCFSRCSKTASFLTRFLLQNYLFYSSVPKCQS